jgi:beta-aspartyl-peptidase (threonine type)
MTDSGRPPLVHLTWRVVLAFLFLDMLLTAAIIVAVVSLAAGAPQTPPEAVGIRSVLDAQVDAWNRGSLDGFMAGYWKDDKLTFFSGDSVTRGWQKTYDRYQKRYQADGKEMGRLEFRNIEVEMIGSDAALARGGWRLTMSDGKTPIGLFTLLFRRLDGKWRIVHDHTSTGETK